MPGPREILRAMSEENVERLRAAFDAYNRDGRSTGVEAKLPLAFA